MRGYYVIMSHAAMFEEVNSCPSTMEAAKSAYAYGMFPLLSGPILDPIANISYRLRLLTVNNLVIPCLVTAFRSPACFQVQS
jgi:hypothetical protein